MKENKTKEVLLITATQLFSENGYEATGVRDILQACGVSTGSFYHFNIMLVIDDFLGRSDLSLEGVILNLANPFIKICVAFFIFLAAATPAKFISLHKMHNLL